MDMKPFLEYINENNREIEALNEALQSEWTPELEARVNLALEEFSKKYQKEDGTYDLERLNEEMTNEGLIGSILGGLTGFALGKTIGQTICRVLNIQAGVLYDMLTSRLVGAALGAALGKRI